MQTSLAETFALLQTQLRRSLWTALPGRVQSFDAAKQSADVEPLVHDTWEAEDGENVTGPLPVIPSVPVCFPGSGGWRVTFPVAKGDTGLLIFCARSIDRWLSEGGSVDPQDARTHDLSDAVFLPGLVDFAHPISPFESDRLTVGKVGGLQVHIKDSKIQVGTDAAGQLEAAVLGNTLRSFLNQLLTALNGLSLPVSGSTAGPPAPGTFPALPGILSATVEVKK